MQIQTQRFIENQEVRLGQRWTIHNSHTQIAASIRCVAVGPDAFEVDIAVGPKHAYTLGPFDSYDHAQREGLTKPAARFARLLSTATGDSDT